MIGKGRNWARMTYLVLSVAGTILMFLSLYILYVAEVSWLPAGTVETSSPAEQPYIHLWNPDALVIRSWFSIPLDIANAIVPITALILLFQRDSSDWFRAMKVLRTPPSVAKTPPRGLEPGEALIEAARKGDLKQIEHFLAIGADVNAQNKWGLTPLMAAAHGGHIVAGKLLLEKGADVNVTQHGGWTALMVAAVKGHVDIVNLVLGKGVDVNAMTESGMTALTLALSNGRSQVAELLKAQGAEA